MLYVTGIHHKIPVEVSSTDEVFQNVKVILEFFGVPHSCRVEEVKTVIAPTSSDVARSPQSDL
jgi:hypothetical protein